jgi:hypothetical protein
MSSTILLPPRAQLCIRYCSNKHTPVLVRDLHMSIQVLQSGRLAKTDDLVVDEANLDVVELAHVLHNRQTLILYRKNSVPQWGAESSLAGQWLRAAGGDGACAARTGSGPMWMCGDIFAAARLWRGRLLTTGHLSSRHSVVVGAGDVAWGSRRRGGPRRGRAPGAALPSACWVFSSVSHL